MYSVAIVGLPNAGKSTLFKALTKKEVEISERPFTTIKPNKALAKIEDQKLYQLAKIVNSEKATPSFIEFIDIAGLIEGAHKGEGLGNEFLAHIKETNLKLLVLRGFQLKAEVSLMPNPEKELKILEKELKMKDLEVIERNLPKLKKESLSKKEIKEKVEILERLKKIIEEKDLENIEKSLKDEEKEKLKEFQFLTLKPTVYLVNTNLKDKDFSLKLPSSKTLFLDCKLEMEISELGAEAQNLGFSSLLDQLINRCYNALDLITFYTIKGGKEAKAWIAKRGIKVIESAQMLHTDFAKNFKKAEVILAEDLIKEGSITKVRAKGLLKIVGKDYQLQGGEVIEFKT